MIIWRKPHAVLDGRWRCWMTTFCLLVEKAAVVVGKEAWFIFWMALGMCSWNDNLHFWPVQSAYEHMAVRNLAWVISTSIFLFILFLVFAIQDCFSAWSCRNETNKQKKAVPYCYSNYDYYYWKNRNTLQMQLVWNNTLSATPSFPFSMVKVSVNKRHLLDPNE